MFLVLSHPLWAATIIVDETTCTLVDAITAANTDTAVGGCAAGSGADTIELTTDVTLTEVNNADYWGSNGLPVVDSEITMEGEGFMIERDGGAPDFRFFEVASSGTLTLNDITLTNGSTYVGGAIFNYGTVTLTNSTLSGNSAVSGGGIHNDWGYLTIENSIIANSGSSGNCSGDPIIDNGNNFADDNTCGVGFAAITPGVDFDTTLADNGGPTRTHALFPGSVAIDAAANCGLETDQRGYPRDDGACDSGSFEFQEPSDVPATTYRGMAVTALLLLVASPAFLLRRRAAQ